MSDKHWAKLIREKRDELNDAIRGAAKSGLEVSVQVVDATTFGETRREHIEVEVKRPI